MMNSINLVNSVKLNKTVKKYLLKMFMLLPLTFLFTPIFYTLLGYHPEMPAFPLFVYLWFTFFIYLGMTLSLILEKFKYLAYLAILIIAFLCKGVISMPALNFQKTVIYSTRAGEEIIVKNHKSGNVGEFNIMYLPDSDSTDFVVGMPLTPDEFVYYEYLLFVSTFVAGCAGIVFSKKTPLEFVARGNLFLFVNILIISSAYYFLSGIMDIDKNAANLFVFYLAAFAVSYFLVRNFTSLDRQIEIYSENGAYNASGKHKVYAYYFIMLLSLSVLPMIICFMVVPYIVAILEKAIDYIIALIFGILLLSPERDDLVSSDDYIPKLDDSPLRNRPDDQEFMYYVLLGIFFIIIFIFRKHIIKLIKYLIEFFMTRANISAFDGNIINKETIVKLQRDKKLNMSYKKYLKKARKIKNLRDRYVFAYNCVFWNIIRLEKDLKESATPEEVAEYIQNLAADTKNTENTKNTVKGEKYSDFGLLTYPYEDIKYGDMDIAEEQEPGILNMLNRAEILLKNIL